MKLTKEEMIKVSGGGISGTMISSIVRGINSLLDLGRSLGTAARRILGKRICPLS